MRSIGAGSLSKTLKKQSKSAIVPAAEWLLCPHPMGYKSPEAPFRAANELRATPHFLHGALQRPGIEPDKQLSHHVDDRDG